MPTIYAVFVDGHFWKAYEHQVTAELTARGFRERGKVVVYEAMEAEKCRAGLGLTPAGVARSP